MHVSHSVSKLFLLSDDMQILMRKNAIANSRGCSDTDVSHSGVGPERLTHTKKQKYEHLNVLKMSRKNLNAGLLNFFQDCLHYHFLSPLLNIV